MFEITSPQNPRIRQAVRLFRSRGRKQQGRFIVCGEREVERCLQSTLAIEEVFGISSTRLERLEESYSGRAGKPIQWIAVSPTVMEELGYGDRPSELVATIRRPNLNLDHFEPRGRGLVMVLEGVEKPGNVGAVFRSCDGAGAAGVVLADPLTDLFHPNSIRTSMGTVFHVPAAVGTAGEVRGWLEGRGYRVLAARPEAPSIYDRVSLTSKVAVVVGNEATGVSDQWRGDGIGEFSIPMLGIADSLNLSVTAALIAYEAARQVRTDVI